MWEKYIILDKSVEVPPDEFKNLKYAGKDGERDNWTRDPGKTKLYTDIQEVIADATRLRVEFPIKVLHIQIPDKQQGGQIGINISEIKF